METTTGSGGTLVIEKQNSRTNYFLIIIIIILLLLLAGYYWYASTKINNSLAQVSALTDTLSITRDEYGRATATIGIIQADVSVFKKMSLAREDSLGRQLQKLVNRRTMSATIVTQNIAVKGAFETTTIEEDTSCYEDSTNIADKPCNPTYILNLDLLGNPWRRGLITASRDSFHLDVKFPEKLTFIQERSKWNLFKPTQYISRYTNENPDVEITGMRTFTVKCDCKGKSLVSFGLGGLAGFGSGFLVGRATK